MLDPRLFRTQLDEVEAQLARRSFKLDTAVFRELENKRKEIQSRTQELQNERNTRSKLVGQAKARGEDIQPLLAEMQHLGEDLKRMEGELDEVQAKLEELLLGIPNILDADVPDGRSDADNVEIHRWGEPPQFGFEPRDHVDLERGWAGSISKGPPKWPARFVTSKVR